MQKKININLNNREAITEIAIGLLENSSGGSVSWPIVQKVEGTKFKICVFPLSFKGETGILTQLSITSFEVESVGYCVIVGY